MIDISFKNHTLNVNSMTNDSRESFLDLFSKIKEGNHTVTRDNIQSYTNPNARKINLNQFKDGFENKVYPTETLPHLKLSKNKYIGLNHEYYSVETISNEVVGILIGDYTGLHNKKEIDYNQYPHIFAVFVKEFYRNQGIGTKLVNEFHSKTDGKIVIDIDTSRKEFYEQTKGEFIYL